MIDVRELRVGNHVLVEGERKWVKSTSYPWIFLDDDVPFHEDHLEPIPLTAELLTELGFKRTNHVCVWRKSFNHSLLTISTRHKGEWSCSLWQEDCRAVLTIRYLHELENFVYMTLHKELIEE